jgi:hypothetical protein
VFPYGLGSEPLDRQPEFVVVTHWDSVAALEALAGPRWQEAVIEPEEEHMLARVLCDHYETTETASEGKRNAEGADRL